MVLSLRETTPPMVAKPASASAIKALEVQLQALNQNIQKCKDYLDFRFSELESFLQKPPSTPFSFSTLQPPNLSLPPLFTSQPLHKDEANMLLSNVALIKPPSVSPPPVASPMEAPSSMASPSMEQLQPPMPSMEKVESQCDEVTTEKRQPLLSLSLGGVTTQISSNLLNTPSSNNFAYGSRGRGNKTAQKVLDELPKVIVSSPGEVDARAALIKNSRAYCEANNMENDWIVATGAARHEKRNIVFHGFDPGGVDSYSIVAEHLHPRGSLKLIVLRWDGCVAEIEARLKDRKRMLEKYASLPSVPQEQGTATFLLDGIRAITEVFSGQILQPRASEQWKEEHPGNFAYESILESLDLCESLTSMGKSRMIIFKDNFVDGKFSMGVTFVKSQESDLVCDPGGSCVSMKLGQSNCWRSFLTHGAKTFRFWTLLQDVGMLGVIRKKSVKSETGICWPYNSLVVGFMSQSRNVVRMKKFLFSGSKFSNRIPQKVGRLCRLFNSGLENDFIILRGGQEQTRNCFDHVEIIVPESYLVYSSGSARVMRAGKKDSLVSPVTERGFSYSIEGWCEWGEPCFYNATMQCLKEGIAKKPIPPKPPWKFGHTILQQNSRDRKNCAFFEVFAMKKNFGRVRAFSHSVKFKENANMLSTNGLVAREAALCLEQQLQLSVHDLVHQFQKGLRAAAILLHHARLNEAYSLEKQVILKKLMGALAALLKLEREEHDLLKQTPLHFKAISQVMRSKKWEVCISGNYFGVLEKEVLVGNMICYWSVLPREFVRCQPSLKPYYLPHLFPLLLGEKNETWHLELHLEDKVFLKAWGDDTTQNMQAKDIMIQSKPVDSRPK